MPHPPASTPTQKLYRPEYYSDARPELIVRAYPFATLITEPLLATATPITFERDDVAHTLVGHLSRKNPHAQAMRDGDAVLAIFSGPHAYISPRWYVEKPEVPTWNYVAAHVRGRLEMLDKEEDAIAVLRRTIEVCEADFENPLSIADMPDGRVGFLTPMIRAFRLHVESIEGVSKLSQKHPPGDRARIVNGLREQPAKDIADLMEERDQS